MQEPEVQFALAIESPEHPAAELATSIEELIVTGCPRLSCEALQGSS